MILLQYEIINYFEYSFVVTKKLWDIVKKFYNYCIHHYYKI